MRQTERGSNPEDIKIVKYFGLKPLETLSKMLDNELYRFLKLLSRFYLYIIQTIARSVNVILRE